MPQEIKERFYSFKSRSVLITSFIVDLTLETSGLLRSRVHSEIRKTPPGPKTASPSDGRHTEVHKR